MREKYESLSAAVLRELAKARGMKGISTLKKAELVEAMLAEDEKEAKVQEAKKEAGIQAYKKGNAWYWHMERSAADGGTGKTCCKPGRTEGEDPGEI